MSNLHVLGYTQTSIGSVTVDVLLAGYVGLTPLQAASTMFDAINRFTVNCHPQYLTQVKIVIFDVTIVESFRQCFLEQGSATGPVEPPVHPSSHRTNRGEATTHQLTCQGILSFVILNLQLVLLLHIAPVHATV